MEAVDITKIAGAVMALLSALITCFLVPYIKSKTTNEEYNQLKLLVKLAVQAAEQAMSGETGEAKKEYVLKSLNTNGLDIDYTSLNNMIESAVYEINQTNSND